MEDTCQICGCSDYDCSQCIERTGKPCYWVDRECNLCSACEEIWIVKTLLDYFEYFRKLGLCNLLSVIYYDKSFISPDKSALIRIWLQENLPKKKYFGDLGIESPSYSWKQGDADSRWYWLQSKLKELKIKDDIDFLHGFIGEIFKDM